jgi:hypothetical protein
MFVAVMIRSYKVLAAGTLACLTLGVVGWVLYSVRPGITEANCNRIRLGMTHDEVEQILGGPPNLDTPFVNTKFWAREDKAVVLVEFTRGVVTRKDWLPPEETVQGRIWRWLGLE